MKILKYKLELKPEQAIRMPESSEIMDVQIQADNIVMWAMVDETSKPTDAKIRMFGTGYIIPSDFEGDYIGTVQVGSFVAHYFVN